MAIFYFKKQPSCASGVEWSFGR